MSESEWLLETIKLLLLLLPSNVVFLVKMKVMITVFAWKVQNSMSMLVDLSIKTRKKKFRSWEKKEELNMRLLETSKR